MSIREYNKKYWKENKERLKPRKQLWDSMAPNTKFKERKIIWLSLSKEEQIKNMLDFTHELLSKESPTNLNSSKDEGGN